jgi:ketosteroid isomerase-like protein
MHSSIIRAARNAIIVLLFITVCGAGRLSYAQRSSTPDPREVQARAASAAWDSAFNSSDLARLMQLYASDAVSMPFERPALEGKAAIQSDFRDFFSAYSPHHQTTIVSLQIAGDWAIERGKYQLSAKPKGKEPALQESGKHIVIRKLVNGHWLIQLEIWNTDSPTK